MAEFSKLAITNKGKALLAKMISGSGNIEFTKISASSTTYEDAQLEELTSLSDIKQTSLVSRVTRTNEVAVKVEAAFTNTELTEGYYMRALGLYAVEPDAGEILYAVTREISGNCYMPAYNGVTVSGAYVQLITTVGNAENISLEVDSGAYATIGDLQDIKESITAESIGAREIQKWTCPVRVGEWSQVLGLTDWRSGILRVALNQNLQTLIYEFHVGVGYSSGYLAQISADGFVLNSEIEIRITQHKDLPLDYRVEILNKYGYQGTEYVSVKLEYEETLSNTTGSVMPYTKYTASNATYSIVKAELVSKYDGIVVKKLYGDLAGNADTVGGKTVADLLNYNNLSNKPTYVTDIFFSGNRYSVSYSNGTRREGEIDMSLLLASGTLTRVVSNSEIYYYITIGETLATNKQYQVTRSPNYTTQTTVTDSSGMHTIEGDIYIGEKVGPPLFVVSNGSTTKTIRVLNCQAKDMWIPKTFNFTYNGSGAIVTNIAY